MYWEGEMEREHKHLLSWFLWRNSIVPLHNKRKEKKTWSTVVESGAVLGYWICSLWRIWWLSSRWHRSWINEQQGHICYCTDYQLWHATSQSYFLSLLTINCFWIIIIDWWKNQSIDSTERLKDRVHISIMHIYFVDYSHEGNHH